MMLIVAQVGLFLHFMMSGWFILYRVIDVPSLPIRLVGVYWLGKKLDLHQLTDFSCPKGENCDKSGAFESPWACSGRVMWTVS
jgi:hypothetical protein